MSMLISAVCMDQDLSVTVAIIVMVFQIASAVRKISRADRWPPQSVNAE